MSITVDTISYLLLTTANLLSFFLLPISLITERPFQRVQESKQNRVRRIQHSQQADKFVYIGDRKPAECDLLEAKTVDELFMLACQRHQKKPCFGVRSRLPHLQGELDKFEYLNYQQVAEKVEKVIAGLYKEGLRSGDRCGLFMETSVEWMLVAQALYKMNVTVVTMFSNLDQTGIIHIIRQTGVRFLVTSADPKTGQLIILLESLRKSQLPVEALIVCKSTGEYKINDYRLVEFESIIENENSYEIRPPKEDSLALIMYTSGSNGNPKGVKISHRNLIASLVAIYRSVFGHLNWTENDLEVAYLPLAHILEFEAEMLMILLGVPIAYSSIRTLSDSSADIEPGAKGDLNVAKPTFLIMVPTMLERLRKAVEDQLAQSSFIKRAMFKFAFSYKRFWRSRGFATPLIDRLVFSKAKAALGGRVKAAICGGAPLSPETQEFASYVFGLEILQGYGATETCAVGTLMDRQDLTFGSVGAPHNGVAIMLRDWIEGGYCSNDVPNPRGEILISCDSLCEGYLDNDEEDERSFTIEEGRRWWITGDIVEILPNGNVKIIDRKKDLVKLSNGQYISFGKIETLMKSNDLIANICLHADPKRDEIVALINPNVENLKKLSTNAGITGSLSELCVDKKLKRIFLENLREYGLLNGLSHVEIPKQVILCDEEWRPDNGLVTTSLKIRRRQIENHYSNEINSAFQEIK